MLYIFEGNEKSGKTTQVKILSKIMNAQILKMPTKKIWFDDGSIDTIASYVYNSVLTQIAKSDCNFICDRAIISALVYSTVYKRSTDLSYIYKKILPALEGNAKIIYLSTAQISDNISRRKNDKFVKNDDYIKIQKEYDKVMKYVEQTYNIEVISVNTSKYDIKQTTNKILELLDYVK